MHEIYDKCAPNSELDAWGEDMMSLSFTVDSQARWASIDCTQPICEGYSYKLATPLVLN